MNAYSQYQENQILTSSPEQILLMLYDGAIRFTRQAMYGLEEGNLPLFYQGITKSMAIITEFSNSLDHSIGGNIAENLDGLYNFMIRELTMANLNKDIEKLRVVDRLLVDLRATWGEAVEINKGQVPASQLSPNPVTAPSNPSAPKGYVPLSLSR
ncbi:MAG: flagellar export chaperone FliS [Proteobacteria bacterium]|nr:flagellar export chaperone FliS [Pseudomonadota bacterium]